MPSPFPGVDPYIEDRGLWKGFHTKLIVNFQDALNAVLPESYVSTVEEDVHIMRPGGDSPRMIRPDALVARDPSARRGAGGGRSSSAVAEPMTLPWLGEDVEEVHQRFLVIVKLPDLHPVTFLELLSPTNKAGLGRSEYLEKRQAIYRGPAHLVEIDLLLRGRPMPMGAPLPTADFFANVSRVEARPETKVYAWGLRQALPTLAIPLEAPDPDVPLDLAAAFATAHARGRYGQILRYAEPLNLPTDPEDRAWAEDLARGELS